MKILLVSFTTETNSGWGRYTRDLARALMNEGHSVVCLNEWLKEKGLPPLHEPDDYLGYSLGWLADRKVLARAIQEFEPDVVHIAVEPYLSLVPLVSIPKQTAIVLTVHGTYAYYPQLTPRFIRPFIKGLYVRALKRLVAITPVSENTQRVLEELLSKNGVVKPKIQAIHNGVWLKDHALPPIPANEKNGFTILSVGAIKARKGNYEILQGMLELRKSHGLKAIYRVVGSLDDADSYVQKLKKFISENGMEDQVVFTGRVSDEQVEDELRRTHVIALLPRAVGNSLEGFGLVYLEANAYGVPGIGARQSASEEAILDGKSGLLCNADDPKDIAEKLYQLSQGVIGPEDARAWALTHDWSNIVKQYLTIYERGA
jgi:glycosyltransferase involved in cell wall biosynthesis